MSPEAWTFLGVAVTALAGIVVVIIQQKKQSKQLGGDGETPTVRAMLQQLVTDQAAHRLAEAQYHAEQDAAISTLTAKVDAVDGKVESVSQRVDRVENLVLGYPEAANG